MACLIDEPVIAYQDGQKVEVIFIEPHSLTLEGKVYRVQKERKGAWS